MSKNLWAIVALICSALILLDVFNVIAIGRTFEILLVAGLVVFLVIFVRSRGKS